MMLNKKLAAVFILVLLGTAVRAQERQLSYNSLLDSMQRENYIAWEVLLDELQIGEGEDNAQSVEDHIRQHHSSNTDKLLHSLPGMHMMRRGNFASEPILRGLTTDRYVMSVEGMRIFGACTDKMDPVSSYVEPINLKSLDVSFGAQGNMIGAGTGGGLNFNLKKPVFNAQKPLSFSANTVYNTVSNGFDQSADLNFSRNKWAFRFSGVHRKAENYRDGRGETVRYSQYEKYNYAAAVHYRISEQHLLAFDFLGDDAKDVGYPALPMDVAYARAKMFGLSYLFPALGPLKHPEVKVYHNFINHAMDDTQRDTVAMHMDMPGFTRTTGGFLKGELISGDKQTLELRMDYFNAFARAEMTMYPNEPQARPMFMLTWPDVRRQAGGAGVNYTKQISKKLFLNYGMRMEYTAASINSELGEQQLSTFGKGGAGVGTGWLNNHNVNLTWKPGAHELMLKSAFSERAPTTSEQFGYYLFNRQDGYDYIGDPELQKERNLHFEVAHRWKSEKFTTSGAVFLYLFDDYIMGIYQEGYEAMTPGALGIKIYENSGKATMKGGELNSQWKISSVSSLMAAAKYVYGADYESDPLPQMPPLKLNLALDTRVFGVSLYPETEWSAKQHRASKKFNERPSDGYLLFHFRMKKAYSWNKIQWQVNGGVENILDKAYREHFDVGEVLRPGRNFYLMVKAAF